MQLGVRLNLQINILLQIFDAQEINETVKIIALINRKNLKGILNPNI